MRAKSKAQQMAAGAALSAKRGETPKSKLKGASKQMVESMTESQLEDFAATKRKGKPGHVAGAGETSAKKTPAKKAPAKKAAGRKS